MFREFDADGVDFSLPASNQAVNDTFINADFGYVMVDWLTVYQVHPFGSVPIVGGDYCVTQDLMTGEIVSHVIKGYQHEGSFDTTIRVRCDGSRIEVSGNPSVYCRYENVFGFQSVQECIDVYNKILKGLGLPLFRRYTFSYEFRQEMTSLVKLDYPEYSKFKGLYYKAYTEYKTNHFNGASAFSEKKMDDGRPIITAIHITENIETGSHIDNKGDVVSNSVMFLRHLSSYVHQKKPGYLFPNGKTVVWNSDKNGSPSGGTRIYHKFYEKEQDIDNKIKDVLKKKADSEDSAIDIYKHLNYLSDIKEWCNQVGLVRNEVELKAKELSERNLQYIEKWSYKAMCDVIRPYQFQRKMKVEETVMDSVMEALIEKGYKESYARKSELIHTSWVNGNKNITVLCGSERSYYRYRNILLTVGVDIAQPCNISKLPLRVNQIKWSNAAPPSWYEMPSVSKIAA